MTQLSDILDHLKRGKAITPIEALDSFGCFRLGARIWELRQDGFDIERELIADKNTGKRYAQYRMAGG